MVVVAPLAEDIFTKVFVSLCGGMRKFTKNKKFKLNVKEQLSHSLSLSLSLTLLLLLLLLKRTLSEYYSITLCAFNFFVVVAVTLPLIVC